MEKNIGTELAKIVSISLLEEFEALVTGCKNCLTDREKELLEKSFYFAVQAYRQQKQTKDLIKIKHSLSVAKIISQELLLGVNSMASSFLHEVIDTGYMDADAIKKEFGETIALIVEGISKISSINTQANSFQAENFRRLLLTMASDIRVILVKIADRLHNMRTIDSKNSARQLKMAFETTYLYAPLAHRLGLYNIKSELEDISLKYLDKDTYSYIDKKLKDTKNKRERYIKKFILPINEKLSKSNLSISIKYRTKSISSIWNKMKKQNVDFDGVYDIYAIRIIIDTDLEKEKEECWKIYSVVADIYQPNPARLRDWLSIPKSNGYESLHTTVMGPDRKWVEVQIRTNRMDEIAEMGLAAHWRYKGIKGSNKGIDDWLLKMRELLETPESSSIEFVDNVKLNLYSDEVFVFTPKGDIKKLPINSTILDFAYDIHSEVGNNCIGAKINNTNVGIREKLNNGDQVEIVTSKNQKPNSDWLNYVVTSKAKSKIKIALKEQKLKEADLGKETIKRRFKNWKVTYNDESINKLLKYYKLNNSIDFYYLVSKEKLDLTEIKEILTREDTIGKLPVKEETREQTESDKKTFSSDYLIIDEKIKNVDYKLSKCCNPIFGDTIFGFVTVSEGIKIHRYNCPNAPGLLAKYPYRVVPAKWTDTEGIKAFQTVVKLLGIDEPGLLTQVSDVVSKDTKVKLRSISVSNNDGNFEGVLKVFVEDTQHLQSLMKRFLKLKGINKVVRYNS